MMLDNAPATAVLRTVGAATVLATLVACGGGQSSTVASPAEQGETTVAPAPAQSTVRLAANGNDVLLAAGETAHGTVPDGTVTSINSEHDNTQWEVQIVTADGVEHDVDVSADGAKVLSGPTANSDDSEDLAVHRSRVQAAKLDYRAAVTAVTQAVDGRITELALDDRNRTVVWEADVIDSANTVHEVSIDAGSGAVVAQN